MFKTSNGNGIEAKIVMHCGYVSYFEKNPKIIADTLYLSSREWPWAIGIGLYGLRCDPLAAWTVDQTERWLTIDRFSDGSKVRPPRTNAGVARIACAVPRDGRQPPAGRGAG